MKEVTKEEFDSFIRSYDGGLSSGVTSICEPPIAHYRDEGLASGEIGSADYFFSGVVAKIKMDWARFENGKMVETANDDRFYKYYIDAK